MTTISATGTLYFRDNLGSPEYSFDNSSWTNVPSWPLLIENSNTSSTLTVLFTNKCILTSPSMYFICVSSNIQFGSSTLNNDGSRSIIDISGVTGYPGLVQNGTSILAGFSNITIVNIELTGTGESTLASNAGWFAQAYFGSQANAILIKNCFTSNIINGGATTPKGGIAGSFLGYNAGSVTIWACSTTGAIGSRSGGIVGECAGQKYGNIIIGNCWSLGVISNNGSGGIVGPAAGDDNGVVQISNCYSSGFIGQTSGGIVGRYAGGDKNGINTFGQVYISYSYSTGSIIFNSGGIVGYQPLNIVTVTNCFSTGSIASGGGIFGGNMTDISLQTTTNCYSSGGTLPTGIGGIYAGSSSDIIGSSSNSYSEGNNGSFGWSDAHAITTLTGFPTSSKHGDTWSQPSGPNTPYLLSYIDFSPYTLTLDFNTQSSIVAGSSSPAATVPGYTYSLLEINGTDPSSYMSISINSTTGSIITSPATTPGIYLIYVYSTKNPYSITQYTLNVSGQPEPAINSCCQQTMDLKGTDLVMRTQAKSGNILIGDNNTKKYVSFEFMLWKKNAYASKR